MIDVAKPYAWRLKALAWVWWAGVVNAEAIPADPSPADVEKARAALRRLLGTQIDRLGLSRPTLDRWFGSASAEPVKEANAAFPGRDALEDALATGVDARSAAAIDPDFRRSGKVFGVVADGDEAWPKVHAAVRALAEPARTRELLDLAPELEALLGRSASSDAPRNWEEVFQVVRMLATQDQAEPVEIRLLGLTMNKAWKPFSTSLLQQIRGDRGDVLVTLDLFQLDPDWAGTALLHPRYPASARAAQERMHREVPLVTARWGPLHVRLRAYRCFLGLTGVAVRDRAVVGVVGGERAVWLNGRAYSTVRQGAAGAEGLLHRQFESCWAQAEQESVTVLDNYPP